MNVIMSPLYAVDLLLLLAPVAMTIAIAVKRRREGDPVEPMLVRGERGVPAPSKGRAR